jgi:hypothetical protein
MYVYYYNPSIDKYPNVFGVGVYIPWVIALELKNTRFEIQRAKFTVQNIVPSMLAFH